MELYAELRGIKVLGKVRYQMVNVSRPFKCSGCGKNIRIMYTGTGWKAVDESIVKVLKSNNPYADHFYNQSGNHIKGNVMVPGDSYYDEAVYAYRPHRCSGKLRKSRNRVRARVPEEKTA